MKLYLFILGLICFNSTGLYAGTGIKKPVQPTCEYLKDPLGIDLPHPRLSWKLESDQKGQKQKAYQIIVSSSNQKANELQGDIWDTGKVISDQSVQLVYNGKALESAKKYYWKVRVWDNNNEPTAYSDAAFWETGFFKKQDWIASWIGAPAVLNWPAFIEQRKLAGLDAAKEPAEAAPQFRKSFTVSGKIVSASLYISGAGFYSPFLNGKQIGDYSLSPAFTRYDKTVLYLTYDVTNLIQEGKNVLGAVLGNGWYNMETRATWGFDKAPWRNRPALLSQLELIYKDGRKEIMGTDSSWKVAAGPITFNSIMQGETYNAGKETPGWCEPEFDDKLWKQALPVSGPAGKLRAQLMPPVKIMEQLLPVKITQPVDGHHIYDFGKNCAGFVHIKVKAKAGAIFTIKYGERLYSNGRVDQEDIAKYVLDRPFQTDTYICKGTGEEEWQPSFAYHGFQYAEIMCTDKNNTIAVKAMVIHTAFEQAGTFECANPLFNTIQQNARRSYVSNFMGYPTDCPQREKNGWTGDAHLASEMGMYNFNNQLGYLKWMQDLRDEQQPTGELPGIVPTSGWGYHWGNGPAFDNALVLIPWYLYQYSGDKQVLADMYPNIKKYVDYLERKSKDLIVDIGLGDWAPAKTKTPVEITSTAYFYTDALTLSKIAGLLGNSADREKYSTLAGKINEAFNRKFYSGKGIYGNNSQTSLATAVYQGLAGSNQAETVATLTNLVHLNDNHLDCGILGTKYLLNVLSANKQAETAYKIVNQHTFPSWGYWIDQGATSLWEKWDGSMSHNHIMFGDVSAWFYKSLGGIQTDSVMVGFKKIIFKPDFVSELQWVNSSHESLYGTIVSNWKRNGKTIIYHVTIPVNTEADLVLPVAKFKVDGVSLERSALVSKSHITASSAKFTLGSGTYTISIQQ